MKKTLPLFALTLAAGSTFAESPAAPEFRDDCIRVQFNGENANCSKPREIDRFLADVFALPDYKMAPGLKGEVLIGPGELYDPLWINEYNGRLWVTDDGKEIGPKGSSIVSFNKDGSGLVQEVEPWRVTAGIDHVVVPRGYPGWEAYADKIISLNQPANGFIGAQLNHHAWIIEPRSNEPLKKLCDFRETAEGQTAVVAEVKFGPEGSPFEGVLIAAFANNGSLHKIYPDGRCEAWVTGLDGAPMGWTFSPDGKKIQAALKRSEEAWTNDAHGQSIVVEISPDGTVSEPIITGVTMVVSMAYAPKEWGRYAGKLILSDAFIWNENPNALSQAVRADGIIWVVDKKGNKEILIENLRNPAGIYFDGKDMYLSDIQGDFMTGRETPDGVIYKFTYEEK